MERKYYFYIALFLTIAITIASLISGAHIVTPRVQFFDKFVHFSAYSVLTLSWLLAFNYKGWLPKFNISVGLSIFIYGIIIEVLQEVLTNSRQADILDLLANLVGVLTAYVIFNTIITKKIR